MSRRTNTAVDRTPLLAEHDAENGADIPRSGTGVSYSGPPPMEQTTEADDQSINSNNTVRRLGRVLASNLFDESGSTKSVKFILSSLFVLGIILGIVLPKDHTLPTVWYRYVSSTIGYVYFCAWSFSFYPQVVSNMRRRSTQGLSVDFCALNVVGFACYAAYNLALFTSPTVQALYRERHHADDGEESFSIPVQSNDVAFAVHALVLSSVTLCQVGYYNGPAAMIPSKGFSYFIAGILFVCLSFPLLVYFHNHLFMVDDTKNFFIFYANLVFAPEIFNWLDYLYLLSYFKVLISLLKYIPQVVLNAQRQSTVGWSIGNILMDFTGGVLSDVQLVLDCIDLNDFSGITGNVAKLGLGLVSVVFDIIFMWQHYVLYREDDSSPEAREERSLLASDETILTDDVVL